MITISYLLDILKYAIAGIGVVFFAFYLVKPYLERSERIQLLELKKANSNQTLPLQLQAYERMVLFIERINPASMLVRVNAPAFAPHELLNLLMSEIRNEYQHNITQQIYVSTDTWTIVKRIKDDTLNLVNNIIKSLPESATGLEASKVILSHLSQLDENPYEMAAALIKHDLEKIL